MIRNAGLKEQLWNLSLLSARYLLALVFFTYACSKLLGKQFGNLTEAELNTPLRELSLFKVAWFLFEDRLFSWFVGLSQLAAACLILFRKTVILGVALFIPILLNILVIDILIMPPSLKLTFIFRLSFYLILCGLILYQERQKIIAIWQIIVQQSARQAYKKWQYLLIPVFIVLIECIHMAFKICYLAIKHYT